MVFIVCSKRANNDIGIELNGNVLLKKYVIIDVSILPSPNKIFKRSCCLKIKSK